LKKHLLTSTNEISTRIFAGNIRISWQFLDPLSDGTRLV